MFEAVSQNVVHACGDDCLNTVPSVYESDDFDLLRVVVKKRRKFFFLSSKYTATPFTLQDLLIGKNEDFLADVDESTMLKEYKREYKLSLKGSAGSKLKAMFEVELSGKDDVNIEFDLGDLQKRAVNIPNFIDLLKERKLDLNHDFVKQVRKNTRKSLCIVVGVVNLTDDVTIETDAQKEGDEKISVDKLKIATIDETSSISSNKDKRLTLPKDTILAYYPNELSIRTSGALELIMDQDVKGGFDEDIVDGTGILSPAPETGVSELFSPIINAERSQRILLRRAVLDLCVHPQAFVRFCDILAKARRCVKNDQTVFVSVGKLKGEVDIQFDSWLELLKFADYTIKNAKVTFPKTISDEFEAIYNVMKCLRIGVDDTTLVTFSQLTNNLAPALSVVLYNATVGRALPITDPYVKAIYDCDNAAQSLLSNLGFFISEGSTLNPPLTGSVRIKAVYQVVYSLFDCRR